MANKVGSHFLIQNQIQVLGLHWPSPAKGWRKVKYYKMMGELSELFSSLPLSPTEDLANEHHVEISLSSILFSVYYLKPACVKAQILRIPRLSQL